jgi:hypothetical protein
MNGSRLGSRLCIFIAGLSACAATAPTDVTDLRFFVGSTETVSVTKVIMQKPFVTRSVGEGKINPDGSLELVQRVKEQNRKEFDRRWQIHEVGKGRFVGTMSEAEGPVSIERIANRYRFRFVIRGNLSVEEWLTPQRDMTTAHIQLTIRKYGVAVAHGDGWIRRTDPAQLRGNGPGRAALHD